VAHGRHAHGRQRDNQRGRQRDNQPEKHAAKHRRPGPRPHAPALPSISGPALVGTAAVAFAAVSGLALVEADKHDFRPRKIRPAEVTAQGTDPETAQLRERQEARQLRASREQARRALDERRRREAEAARRKRAEEQRRKQAEAERNRPEVAERIAVDLLRRHAGRCEVDLDAQREETLDATQWRNARIIVDEARRLGLPPRAAVIAIAAARQESALRNLRYGDLDSLGLFQQRPSMGWGTVSQVLDPVYAARSFYRALADVPGWQAMPVTRAAQTVQRSAFPDAYARWELLATQVVARLAVADADELTCRAA